MFTVKSISHEFQPRQDWMTDHGHGKSGTSTHRRPPVNGGQLRREPVHFPVTAVSAAPEHVAGIIHEADGLMLGRCSSATGLRHVNCRDHAKVFHTATSAHPFQSRNT